MHNALKLVLSTLIVLSASASFAQRPDARVTMKCEKEDFASVVQSICKKTGALVVVEPSDHPYQQVTLDLRDASATEALGYLCKAAGADIRREENGVFVIRNKPAAVRRIHLLNADARFFASSFGDFGPPDLSGPNLSRHLEMAAKNANLHAWLEVLSTVYFPSFKNPIFATSLPSSNRKSSSITLAQPPSSLNDSSFNDLPGISLLSYDPTDNSLVALGTTDALDKWAKVVSDFDNANKPPYVTLVIEFLPIIDGAQADFQMVRGVESSNRSDLSYARAGDSHLLGVVSGNTASRFRTQLLEGFGKSANAFRVLAANKQAVTAFYLMPAGALAYERAKDRKGQDVVSTIQVPMTVVSGMTVTPTINADGTITLHLAPQINEVGRASVGKPWVGLGNALADRRDFVTNSQPLTFDIVVRDEETVAITGLFQGAEGGSEGRHALLADLPRIGASVKAWDK